MINEIKPGKTSIGYYLAENPEVRTTSGGKQFLSVALKDKTGTIEAKKWDLRPSEIEKYEKIPHAIPDPTQSCGVSAASGAQDQKAERLFIS